MKFKKAIAISLCLLCYSFLSIDNALGLYVIASNDSKVFEINYVSTTNIKRIYFETYNWWNVDCEQYLYLYNSSNTTICNATFPGANINNTGVLLSGDLTSTSSYNTCRYYYDIDLNLYDTCILSRCDSSTKNAINQTINLTLSENINEFKVYTGDNDKDSYGHYNCGTDNIEINDSCYFYVKSNTTGTEDWGYASALSYIYAYNNADSSIKNKEFPGLEMFVYSTTDDLKIWRTYIDYSSYDTVVISRYNPNDRSEKWAQTSNITLDSSFNTLTMNGNIGEYTTSLETYTN